MRAARVLARAAEATRTLALQRARHGTELLQVIGALAGDLAAFSWTHRRLDTEGLEIAKRPAISPTVGSPAGRQARVLRRMVGKSAARTVSGDMLSLSAN
jgi:hypothetical protein